MIYSALKRSLDLIGASVCLIISAPVLILVAIIIKLDSEGSVFVKESFRVGRNKRIFRMYKFRTMVKDAHLLIRQDPKFKKLYEQYKNNSFKLNDDPRITRFGYWLRKTSLDEFPQFFNVIKGDMSLVGPRAYYPDELAEQRKKNPGCTEYVDQALSVKPGITGLWQVSGRSRIGFEDRIRLDANYAQRDSLWLDLIILFKTPAAVFKGEGVY